MKAVLKSNEGPGIELVDVDVPKIGETDILVKVKASSICGSDLHLYTKGKGEGGLDTLLRLPVILGHEFSGEVVDIGSKVRKVSIGDRITASPLMPCGECDMCQGGRPELCLSGIVGLMVDGAMSEYVRLTSGASIYKLPDHISYEAGSLIEPLAVAMHGVEISNFKVGDTAVISGPGPIGLMVLQILKAAGASFVAVTGTNADGKRLKLAEELGADLVVNVEEEDVLEKAIKANRGAGFDFVFEASGSAGTVSPAVGLTKNYGKVVLLGMYTGASTFNPVEVVLGSKCIMGSLGYDANTWDRCMAIVDRGMVTPEAIADLKIDLVEAEKGFEMAARKEAIKVILVP